MSGYFLVHSDFAFSEEAATAGARAIGLWVRAGSWCLTHSPTFAVPRALVPYLGATARTAGRLVDARLWEPTETGWSFVPNPRIWGFERTISRPQISASLRRAVLERDGHRCRACGTPDDLQMDHVHPWSLGGATALDNLQALCGPCNRKKGARVDV